MRFCICMLLISATSFSLYFWLKPDEPRRFYETKVEEVPRDYLVRHWCLTGSPRCALVHNGFVAQR